MDVTNYAMFTWAYESTSVVNITYLNLSCFLLSRLSPVPVKCYISKTWVFPSLVPRPLTGELAGAGGEWSGNETEDDFIGAARCALGLLFIWELVCDLLRACWRATDLSRSARGCFTRHGIFWRVKRW